MLEPVPDENLIRCPSCAELIRRDAILCRFCETGLSDNYFRPCPSCAESIRKEATFCRFCRSTRFEGKYGTKGLLSKQSFPDDDPRGLGNKYTDNEVGSYIGDLSSTDPSNLLQLLAYGRKTGLLTVKREGQNFFAIFREGKLTHARLDLLEGQQAVIQFVIDWQQGSFVFLDDEMPAYKNMREQADELKNFIINVLPKDPENDQLRETLRELGERTRESVAALEKQVAQKGIDFDVNPALYEPLYPFAIDDIECAVNQSLDRIILEAALNQDRITRIVNELPNGYKCALKSVPDFFERWQNISGKDLKYLDGSALAEKDKNVIATFFPSKQNKTFTVEQIVQELTIWNEYQVLRAIQLLINNGLIKSL